MYNTINELSYYIRDWRINKGFKTPSTIDNPEEILAKLMLVVTEIGEAAEAVRHGDFINFKEEIADTLIRLFDITGTMNINIEQEINKKMLINEKRIQKHGKLA